MNVDGIGAIVVGGAHGLGAMIACALGDAGADVSIFDIDGAKAAEVAAVFGGYSQHCDLRDETVVAACVTSTMSRFGQAARVIVNCAMFSVDAPIIGPEGKVFLPLFNNAVAVNLIGVNTLISYGVQAMIDMPPMEHGTRGIIINVLPLGTGNPTQTSPATYASTMGARALIEAADHGLSARNIRCLTMDVDDSAPDEAVKTILNQIASA